MAKKLLIAQFFLLVFIGAVLGQEVKWTWMGGAQGSQLPEYGKKGETDAKNSPGNITQSVYWTDAKGDFWVYGMGNNTYGKEHTNNVVWKMVDTEWMWVHGDNNGNGSPIRGTKGVADKKNTPGERVGATACYGNGKLFLYGGSSGDVNSPTYDGLWEWDGKVWNWVFGSPLEKGVEYYGVKGVPDSRNNPGGRIGATTWVDTDGNFWLFGGTSGGALNDLWKWDGKMWTWISGNDAEWEHGVYGTKGIPNAGNAPGSRTASIGWTDKENLYLYAGVGEDSTGAYGMLNDLWRWDGKYWTWIKGEPGVNTLGHYGQKLLTAKGDAPKSRVGAYMWKDPFDRVWIFGGFHAGQFVINDLWVWDGADWTWMHGSPGAFNQPSYGVKGVDHPMNEPGSRYSGVCWTGANGDLWMYGGHPWDGDGSLYESDLWRLRQDPFSKMVVTGNGRTIEEQDITPERRDNTDFGSLSISNVPIKRTFQIKNKGTTAFTLWEDPIVVNGGSQYFSVVKQPTNLQLNPGDSVSFTIAFDPGMIGKHNTSVIVNSKDRTEPYIYAITGMGTPPNINLIDKVTCSGARLFIKPRNVDHYTVLISDSGKTEFPVDNENYNYSPYYLRAPLVKEHARIVYQGSKNTLEIGELVSGRSYQLVVVPGNGGVGNTTYFADSSSILYFRTPASKWQDSLEISPSVDSAICETDTLNFEGASPFAIQWNDGQTIQQRTLSQSDEYYFLSVDPDGCWMSSDSVNLERFLLPVVDSVFIINPKPWCEGDILEMKAAASHKVIWSSGEEGATLPITENGEYSMVATSLPGCSTKGSLSVHLKPLPDAYFLVDVYQSYGEEVELSYVADESPILWIYAGDTFTKESNLKINTDGKILLVATASNGCNNIDTAQVIRTEVVLRAIPNAFSPNDDGVNDEWVFLLENDSGVLTVFNRWGGIMYYGDPKWNGKIFEEPVPTGIYFYHYRTEEDGKEEVLSGKVQVIR